MKAIVFDTFGKAEVLHTADVAMPELRPGDLLVRVHAAGVNRADILQREGYYGSQSYGESNLLGLELAGDVIATGSDVTDIAPGTRVMAIVGGGDYLARNLRSLRPGGRLVQVGLLSGEDEANIPLSLLLHNHLKLIGTVMKSRSTEEKRAMVQRFADGALPLFVSGRLLPLVGKVFPLEEAAKAHQYMEAGNGFGKTVLNITE